MYNFIISSLIEAGISLITCVVVLIAVGAPFFLMLILKKLSADFYWPQKHPNLWLVLCMIPAACLSIICIEAIDALSHGISCYMASPLDQNVIVPICLLACAIMYIVLIGHIVRKVKALKEKKKQASQSPI